MLVAALLAAGATGCSGGSDGEPDPSEGATQAWRQLPDPPLSPRTDAVVVGVDDRVLVVGGGEFLCPPGADCVAPERPLLGDGAVYDTTTDSWRTVAPPPFGLRKLGEFTTTSLDGTVYLLTSCADGPTCSAPPRLLSYRPADDRWTDHGAVPGPERNLRITSLDRTLLVYTDATALGRVPDLVLDLERSTWTELPADPLPAVYDRFIVPVGDQLVLAGSSITAPGSGESPRKLLARLDLASGTWTALPNGPGQAFQLFPSDRGPLLAGHFADTSSAWVLDPGSWTWSALPEHRGGGYGLGGVLGRDRASYSVHGFGTGSIDVYDTHTDAYVTIPPPPGREDVYSDSSTALGRDLVVYGGQRWPEDDDGELVGDAWVWTAPAD